MGTASSKSTHRRSASRVHARSMALDRLPGTNNMQPKRAATGCVTKCHQSLFALLLSDHQRQAIRTRSLDRRYQWSDMIHSEVKLHSYQIGRASCRERVCQYVYISGVAV